MRKLTAKQKASFREVLDGLVAESVERAKRREEFLEGLHEFLDSLDGQQKVWLWQELERQRCGEFLK